MTDAAESAYAAAYRYAYRYDRVGNRLNEHRGRSQTPGGVEGLDIEGVFNELNQLTNLAFSGRIDTYGTVTSTNSGLGVKVMGEDATMYDTTNFLGGALLGIGTNQGTYTISVVTTNAPGYQSNTVFSVQLPPECPQPLLYDANGNLTNDGIWAYSWNDENRLSAIVPLSPAADKAKVEFIYDGQGRRAKRVLYTGWNGSGYAVTNETRFVYDGWRVLAELSADNIVSNSYVWGLDLSQSIEGAGGIAGLLAMTTSAAESYLYFFDGNGNVTQLYETDGTTEVAAYDYDPFGRMTRSSGSMADTNTFRFSTKHLEPDFKFYEFGYRKYFVEWGRWPNRDPIGQEGGLNLYAYCANNPVDRADLHGLKLICCIKDRLRITFVSDLKTAQKVGIVFIMTATFEENVWKDGDLCCADLCRFRQKVKSRAVGTKTGVWPRSDDMQKPWDEVEEEYKDAVVAREDIRYVREAGGEIKLQGWDTPAALLWGAQPGESISIWYSFQGYIVDINNNEKKVGPIRRYGFSGNATLSEERFPTHVNIATWGFD